ncbi:hypothetical protein ACLOJK_026330 [Asimina triloba]
MGKKEKEGEEEEEEEEKSDPKSQLVTDICFTASRSITCRHRSQHARKPAFIDWYLLLRVRTFPSATSHHAFSDLSVFRLFLHVEENSGGDVIRKRFRQLGARTTLQLHPDKNTHPKAEVAFKLISEAYACLSDKEKRRAFNSERLNNFCGECDGRFQSENLEPNGSRKRCNSKEQSRSQRVLQTLKVIERMEEEAVAIENCLRVHAAASKKEFPLFDPFDYVTVTNYPHLPTRIQMNSNKEEGSVNRQFMRSEQNPDQSEQGPPNPNPDIVTTAMKGSRPMIGVMIELSDFFKE